MKILGGLTCEYGGVRASPGMPAESTGEATQLRREVSRRRHCETIEVYRPRKAVASDGRSDMMCRPKTGSGRIGDGYKFNVAK